MRTVRLKDVRLGSGRTKVIVPVTGATVDELVVQVDALAGQVFDIIEWRADLLADHGPGHVLDAARELVAHTRGRPLLFTLRTDAEGGRARIGVADYVRLNLAVAASGLVDAVDVELMQGPDVLAEVVAGAHRAGVAVVGSNHDFEATPTAGQIISRLRRIHDAGADVAKLACMPRDPGDVLTLLQATWQAAQDADGPIITMSMAGLGMVSRVTGTLFGSAATFAQVGNASAPGQIPLAELNQILHTLEPAEPASGPALGPC